MEVWRNGGTWVYHVLVAGERYPTHSDDKFSCKKNNINNSQVTFRILFPILLSMGIGSNRRHSHVSYLDSSLWCGAWTWKLREQRLALPDKALVSAQNSICVIINPLQGFGWDNSFFFVSLSSSVINRLRDRTVQNHRPLLYTPYWKMLSVVVTVTGLALWGARA